MNSLCIILTCSALSVVCFFLPCLPSMLLQPCPLILVWCPCSAIALPLLYPVLHVLLLIWCQCLPLRMRSVASVPCCTVCCFILELWATCLVRLIPGLTHVLSRLSSFASEMHALCSNKATMHLQPSPPKPFITVWITIRFAVFHRSQGFDQPRHVWSTTFAS